MRIVVDASILVAALMANGTVRDALLSPTDHEYVAPKYLESELDRQLSRISARSGLPIESVRALIEDLLEALELIPVGVYAEFLPGAASLVARANAAGDQDYVALALFLDAPIWTLDKDFDRISEISVLKTPDIAD